MYSAAPVGSEECGECWWRGRCTVILWARVARAVHSQAMGQAIGSGCKGGERTGMAWISSSLVCWAPPALCCACTTKFLPHADDGLAAL